MIRRMVGSHAQTDRHGFRYRGKEVTRLEAFSDVVFGFALTLLVVSLEVPKTFAELRNAMHDFVAFAICFALLILVWNYHCLFFRRYGLQDSRTMLLNSILLFTVLFYVYPLKFLFTFIVNAFTGRHPATQGPAAVLTDREVPLLMITYGIGFAAVFAVFALMYRHALAKSDELELNPLEQFETRSGVMENLVMVGFGLACCTLAVLLPLPWVGASGWIFALITPVFILIGRRNEKIRQKLRAQSVPPAHVDAVGAQVGQ